MLKLAHACTYSFYRIENRVNNSSHESWLKGHDMQCNFYWGSAWLKIWTIYIQVFNNQLPNLTLDTTLISPTTPSNNMKTNYFLLFILFEKKWKKKFSVLNVDDFREWRFWILRFVNRVTWFAPWGVVCMTLWWWRRCFLSLTSPPFCLMGAKE